METSLPGGAKEGDEERMMPQTELLELIVKTAEENCNLDTPISLEELPAAGDCMRNWGKDSGMRHIMTKV